LASPVDAKRISFSPRAAPARKRWLSIAILPFPEDMRRTTAAQDIACDVFMKHHNDARKARAHYVKNNSTALIGQPPSL
jgi:hypothetical protein